MNYLCSSLDKKCDIVGLTPSGPTFFTTRVFRKITAKSVRSSLIESGKYGIDDLPSERTISSLLCDLGFPPRKVVKSRPLKKIPQTDAIFERLHKINNEADNTPGVIRLSIDVKAAIKVGPFSRGGISRRRVKACDHDFAPVCTLQLAGINLPQQGENYFHFNETKANADMIMDTLEHFWPKLRERHSKIDKLVLNLDNGPENHSRRTQFIKRLVDFVDMKAIPVTLAYYPPYHSKYNPIERVWGVLEQHWNGDLLSTREKVFGLAETMEWRGGKPEINVSDQIYEKGVKLAASEMRHYESRLQRASGLEPWFVDICPN
jgi:transposase